MNINSSIGEIKGIGEKTKGLFEKLGVFTIRDMLLAFPRDYRKFPTCEKIQNIVNGKEYAICAKVKGTPVVKGTRNMAITFVKLSDETGEIEGIWYRMPYIKNSLKSGEDYIFFGKVIWKNGHYVMEQPVVYTREQYQALADTYQPVYPLVKGLTNTIYRKAMRQSCDLLTDAIEFLPEDIIRRQNLMDYKNALEEIHFPQNLDRLQMAHDRLAFNEFLMFLLAMQSLQSNRKREENACVISDTSVTERILEKLPYDLTGAQKHAVEEILSDMKGKYMMQRLLQGDVGSGKTIVAFLAMAVMASNGYQAAIMAPTEVLARQHYESFVQWCREFGLDYPVILLTGSATAKEKRLIYEQISMQESALIIGTHALIQEKVEYQRLGLVITDEQHRFGVRQREVFSEKGLSPHILVMSATPIPRTLAIILYGNFDISVMNELPAKRLPIKNCVVDENYRKKAYAFVTKEVEAGHQAYIICPLVEESENMEAENVVDYTKRLKQELPAHISVAYLHGKMKAKEKNEIMEAFLKREIQVLVSTTVIEVGVNVPNATVMMIENAERFGLAQLHQLRGRVGRGDAQSYCILMNLSGSKKAGKRLEILNRSNDGFEIAAEDLKLRGPGDFFGIRQSGMLAFAVGDVYNDAGILAAASEESKRLLEQDMLYRDDCYSHLLEVLQEYRNTQFDKINI